jgi:DNA polymerase I
MELKFQLLDCDYFMNGNRAVVRLFGKTEEGKTVCVFNEDVEPYFYVLPSGTDKNGAQLVADFLKKKFGSLITKIENVQRFLPIGFQEEKSDMLKVTLTDPSKVPSVREELRTKPFVKKIFEADVLFKYRFMVDRNLRGMETVKAIGNPSTTTTVKTKHRITATKIEPCDESFVPNLKYMSLDIEVVSAQEGLPDARKDEIAMISLAFHPNHNGNESLVLLTKQIKNGDKTVKTFVNEREMLKEFLKIVDLFDPDFLVGYNINGFDFPYIIERFRQCGVPCMLGRGVKKPATSRKFGMWYRNTATGRVIVDAYDLIKESAGKGLVRLKRYGLGDVSKVLLNEDKVDIAHSEIGKYWNGDDRKMEKLISYSRKDSILALKLVLEKNMLDKFIELSKVSGVLLQDVLSSGESIRMETLLLKKFNETEFVLPCRPTQGEISRRNIERETKFLKGALVLEPETGLHTSCVVYLDFKSMYPSIYISYNICPTTLLEKGSKEKGVETPYGIRFIPKDVRRGIIPQIVEQLITERDIVKKQMRAAKNENIRRELNAKQFALKIMANAFYGYTGYTRAKLYVLDIANAITSCGRDLIQKTKDIVEEDKQYKVIYGDTDSIMVKTETKDLDDALKTGLELEEKINKELSGIVKMKIESIFKSLLILTKKRYAGWSFEKRGNEWEDKLIMKGIETIRRDWCDLVSDTLFRVLEIILKEQDPKKAFEYVRGVLKKLQNNEIPIENLVITKSISKPIRSYKGIQPHVEVVKKMRKRSPGDAPGVGDRIGFVITQGLRLLSNRAEDPEYAKTHGLKIDSKYYIENQLMPPLERVFESMGIDKSELHGVGRQTLLTTLFNKKKQKNGEKTKSLEIPLNSIDGVICEKCSKTYRRPPLIGKCDSCGGRILFYKGNEKSKHYFLSKAS